jgi:hypothetical protein
LFVYIPGCIRHNAKYIVINNTPSVSINSGFSLFPERLLTPAEGLSSMGLFIAEGDFGLKAEDLADRWDEFHNEGLRNM